MSGNDLKSISIERNSVKKMHSINNQIQKFYVFKAPHSITISF